MYDEIEYQRILGEIFKKKFLSRGFRTLLRQCTVNDLANSFELITSYKGEFTKEEYIDIFSSEYEEILENILSMFHQKILDFIYYIVDEGGEIIFNKLNPTYAVTLKLFLIAFPIRKDEQNVLLMPNEVMSSLYTLNKEEIYQKVQKNDLIIKYNNRLLELYGIYDLSLLRDYIKEYEHIDVNLDELFLLLNIDSLFQNEYDIEDGKIISFNIEEVKDFTKNYEENLEYYHFSQEELFGDFTLENQYQDLIDFVEEELETPYEMACEAARLIDEALKLGLNGEEITQLFNNLDINMYQKKCFEKEIEKASFNCHLWTLKGHTKNELNMKNKFIPFKSKK